MLFFHTSISRIFVKKSKIFSNYIKAKNWKNCTKSIFPNFFRNRIPGPENVYLEPGKWERGRWTVGELFEVWLNLVNWTTVTPIGWDEIGRLGNSLARDKYSDSHLWFLKLIALICEAVLKICLTHISSNIFHGPYVFMTTKFEVERIIQDGSRY